MAGRGSPAAVVRAFRRSQSITPDAYLPLAEAVVDRALEERVRRLAVAQSERGFLADWKRNDDGSFLIEFRHCPIRTIAGRYPQACECERAMMEGLLGVGVSTETRMLDGHPTCCYRIATNRR